jgi:hypothetical protein
VVNAVAVSVFGRRPSPREQLLADLERAPITTTSSRQRVTAARPVSAEDCASDFVEEVRAAFQPMSSEPLSREDAAEIIDNLGRFGAILQRWAIRRAARAEASSRGAEARLPEVSMEVPRG